jgi:[methyl-Co(III) methanol-specific corrinoid protein]:coenzyme M methyltransferase
MSSLAMDVNRQTGFENFGVPFCMTVEAEVLGSEINYGSLECEPKIQKEVFPSVTQVEFKPISSMENNKRVNAILKTIYDLSSQYTDIPVIGSLTGPVSTAASIVDPMTFLKQLRRDKENAHKVLDYVTEHLIKYAALMIENGAATISIADPTATGEILGPKMFEEYAVPYLNKITDFIHKMGKPVIIHICGKMDSVIPQVARINSDAISVDAFVNLKKLKTEIPNIVTMGNVSTIALEFGEPAKINTITELLLRDKTDIIAPACGLSTSTPLKNIKAMTDTVSGF